MRCINDLLDEAEAVEFRREPSTLIADSVREYEMAQPRLLCEKDNHAVQQAIIWASLGDKLVGYKF